MSSSISNSRRHVLAFAASLVLGLVAFVLGSEALVRVAMRSDPYEAYRARFRAAASDVVAIGDSRTAANIAGAAIENLGQAGDDLETVLAKLDARHARRPLRTVFLQADPHQFAAYRVFKGGPDKVGDLVGDPPLLAMLRPNYRQYLLAYWRVALTDPMRFVRAPEPARDAPAALPDPTGAAWRDVASARVQFHIPLAAPRSLPVFEAYRRTISALRRDGVRVCLVTHPVSQAYRAAAQRYPSFSTALALYDQVAAELGVARANLWDQLDDASFADTDHLRSSAAAAYSELMMRRCFVAAGG